MAGPARCVQHSAPQPSLLSHTGDPAEFAFHGVVLPDLKTLDLSADIANRDQDPAGGDRKSPIPVFCAKEARDPGEIAAFVLKLFGDRRMTHDRRGPVPKTAISSSDSPREKRFSL